MYKRSQLVDQTVFFVEATYWIEYTTQPNEESTMSAADSLYTGIHHYQLVWDTTQQTWGSSCQ